MAVVLKAKHNSYTGSFTATKEGNITIPLSYNYPVDGNFYLVVTSSNYSGSYIYTFNPDLFKITAGTSATLYAWPHTSSVATTFQYAVSNNIVETGDFSVYDVGAGSYKTATVNLSKTYSSSDSCYLVPTEGKTISGRMAPYIEPSHRVIGDSVSVIVRSGSGYGNGGAQYSYNIICL